MAVELDCRGKLLNLYRVICEMLMYASFLGGLIITPARIEEEDTASSVHVSRQGGRQGGDYAWPIAV